MPPSNLVAYPFVVAILVFSASDSAQAAQPIRVEFNGDHGRKDVLTRGFEDWRIGSGLSFSKTIQQFQFRLRSSADDAPLHSDWWTTGFDHGATLSSDGVCFQKPIPHAEIELEIVGLSPGHHRFVSWHNNWHDNTSLTTEAETLSSHVKGSVTTSCQVTHNDDAAVIVLELNAIADQPTIIRFRALPTSHQDVSNASTLPNLYLNAFAIDIPDPRPQACKPRPLDGDEHVAERPVLRWTTLTSTGSFRIYLANSQAALALAEPDQSLLIGHTNQPQLSADMVTKAMRRHRRTANLDWFWRVDCVDESGHITQGNIWRFRLRQTPFDSAEGYGQYAAGGRGGRVIEVTNLNDDGPGSLRAAVNAEGPRTVIFRVGGTIKLESKLIIYNPYITIAGQSAPGDGVCIRGYSFGALGSHDVVIQHVRIRVGDEAHQTMDGTGFAGCDHCIMDHCSISWSIDEGISSRGAKNVTFQRCLVSEALNIADHRKYKPGTGHSFAASISGDIGSFHHNLLAHCAGRNWSLAGGLTRGGKFAGHLDIRNNVVYNWATRTTDGGVKGLNFVGNFYVPGPATKVFHLVKPDIGSPTDPQQYFISGNVMDGRPEYSADNWHPKSVVVDPAALDLIRLPDAFCPSLINEQSAKDAYTSVLADVGANYPALDAHDQRIIREVRERTTTYQGSRGGLPGIIDSQTDVGGWPDLKAGEPSLDTDHDGLPDRWETTHALDPSNASDAQWITPTTDWTYLETYLQELTTQR